MTPTQPPHTTTEVSEAMVERERGQRENTAFHTWWESSGHAADTTFTLTMQNCAHAAWQARALSPGDGVPGMVLVPEDDLLFAYRGLLVLRTMFRKEMLTGGQKATEEIITKLGEIAPQLPALSSLRSLSQNRGAGE